MHAEPWYGLNEMGFGQSSEVDLTKMTQSSSRHSSLSYLRTDFWDPRPFQDFNTDGTRNSSSIDGQVGLSFYFRSSLSKEKVFVNSYGVFELLGETGGFFTAIFGLVLMLFYFALWVSRALTPWLNSRRRGAVGPERALERQSSGARLKRHRNYQFEEAERILAGHILQSLLDTGALNADQTNENFAKMLEKFKLCELPYEEPAAPALFFDSARP